MIDESSDPPDQSGEAMTAADTTGEWNPAPSGRRDFFISHAGSDQHWAEWVGRELIAAGYTVELDIWEWAPGIDFVAAMESALASADRIITIYSPEYFSRPYTLAEHRGAFVGEMDGRPGRIVPVVVEPCRIPDLYAGLIRIDLVGLEESEAAHRLLAGISARPGPTANSSSFPGRFPVSPTEPVEAVFYPRRLPETWNIPARNALFTGRTELLRGIRERLAGTAPDRLPVAVVPLQGMGGIGKTQLAIEYAHRFATSLGIVWWVRADSPTAMMISLSDLAQELSVPVDDPTTTLHGLWRILTQRTDWLLIFDNIVALEDLAPFRPPDTGQLLITSRNPAIGRIAATFEVTEFARDESTNLLRRQVTGLSERQADAVAEAVGDLPLAVEQAAGFLSETGMDISDYLELLASEPVAAGLGEATLDRHPGLISIVDASQSRLLTRHPAVAAQLDRLAFFGPAPIPLVASPEGHKPASFGIRIGDALTTATTVRELTALALVSHTGATIQLHRLVQVVLRARLEPAQRHDARKSAQRLLGETEPGDPDEPESWPAFGALAPHIRALNQSEDVTGGAEPEAFRSLLIAYARYLYVSGQYQAGREVAEGTYRHWQQTLGNDHTDTLNIGNRLIGPLFGLGDYETARDLSYEVLAYRTSVLGPDHPDTLGTMNNLAAVLSALGDFETCRELCEQILHQRTTALGPDHPFTLTATNNLAAALDELNDYAASRDLALDALARRRRVLGENHTDTLFSATVLAFALSGLGEYAEAGTYFEDALTRRRRILGPNHPDTLYTAMGYANVLAALGEIQASYDLHSDTLDRRLHALGRDHPDTQQSALALDKISNQLTNRKEP